MGACTGRTMENMTPSGDTVEVVVMQDTMTNNQTQTLNE